MYISPNFKFICGQNSNIWHKSQSAGKQHYTQNQSWLGMLFFQTTAQESTIIADVYICTPLQKQLQIFHVKFPKKTLLGWGKSFRAGCLALETCSWSSTAEKNCSISVLYGCLCLMQGLCLFDFWVDHWRWKSMKRDTKEFSILRLVKDSTHSKGEFKSNRICGHIHKCVKSFTYKARKPHSMNKKIMGALCWLADSVKPHVCIACMCEVHTFCSFNSNNLCVLNGMCIVLICTYHLYIWPQVFDITDIYRAVWIQTTLQNPAACYKLLKSLLKEVIDAGEKLIIARNVKL